jgi:hypothetical protein
LSPVCGSASEAKSSVERLRLWVKTTPPGGVARTSVAPPTPDEIEHNQLLLFSAISGLMHRSKVRGPYFYSITSSARARRLGGTVRPSALAALRLITNSNLVGA